MFDSTFGRFLQRDPVRPPAGRDNLYAYVGDRPANATDPTGRAEKNMYVVTNDPAWTSKDSVNFAPADVERFDPKDANSLVKAINKGLKKDDCVKELEIGGHNTTGPAPLSGNLYNKDAQGKREREVGKLLNEKVRFCDKCEIYVSACNSAHTANLQALADETPCTVYGTTCCITGARFTKNFKFTEAGGEWKAFASKKIAPAKK